MGPKNLPQETRQAYNAWYQAVSCPENKTLLENPVRLSCSHVVSATALQILNENHLPCGACQQPITSSYSDRNVAAQVETAQAFFQALGLQPSQDVTVQPEAVLENASDSQPPTLSLDLRRLYRNWYNASICPVTTMLPKSVMRLACDHLVSAPVLNTLRALNQPCPLCRNSLVGRVTEDRQVRTLIEVAGKVFVSLGLLDLIELEGADEEANQTLIPPVFDEVNLILAPLLEQDYSLASASSSTGSALALSPSSQ